uniref:PAS domain S-box protein n=1 Tax=Methanosarcina horonobensis TaxID=418008 RepID=UPI00373FCEAF
MWVNPAYAESCHMKPEELVGKNHFVLYPHEENEAIFRKVRDTGKGVFFKDKPFVYPDQPERGVTYWDWSLVPVKNSDGNVTGLVLSLRETTKYKQAEETLNEIKERLQFIVDNSPDSIFLQDSGLRYVWVPKPIEGLSIDQYLGHTDIELGDIGEIPESGRELHAIKQQILESGIGRTLEMTLNGSAGSQHFISTYEPWSNKEGKIIGLAGYVRDITERKKAENTLHEAHEELQIKSEKLQAVNEELQLQSEELQAQTEELKEAYEAMSESEKRCRLLFDHSLDAIILTDPRGNGKILSANPAACRLLGWSEKELIGKGRDAMFDPEDPALSSLLDKRTRSGSAKVQLTYRRKDGTRFIGELNTALFTDINGEPRAVAIIRDITERKHMEEALRESEESFRTLFNSMSEGFAVQEVVYDGEQLPVDLKFIDVNPAFEWLIGLERADVIGKLRNDLFAVADPYWLEKYNSVVLTGEPAHFENYSKALNRYFEVYAFPIKPPRFGVIFMDITERKRAEEALKEAYSSLEIKVKERTAELEEAYNLLKESEERFRISVKNTKFVLSQFNSNLRYTWIYNPHPDFDASLLIGKRGDELENSDEMRRFTALKRQVLKSGKGIHEEISFSRSDGVHTYDTIIEPLYNDTGNVIGGTVSALDITDRKKSRRSPCKN